ncbi:MoaA/NifB/PqqE/SkfB family radical SAM enzyme [Chelatococcus asaccharovorans]|uniref:MoaA/NifB/PqqE/SkfB family radical SAM enzyme n=2 Tax=Chelatococcus asaccharovorans TaxID=28210 RepID=A0A2V3UBD7_9HYPH|nr:MoaA/NifB/PqqE/SkfB family radical SAM enzyme [Chelatococcus asaccharovorans]CAH1655360.1 MoaA/NifB/PqqE/SkfB family radical SAM enzyme [Chelatococcus asaccharovorans]CAH1685451.1 MoaA/NifB/PqqE/SkfB family radical SAM enzyme [Chelatococcus asaccharovorans]
MTVQMLRTGNASVKGSPVWLWLDPTTRCNLACRLCYTKASHGKDDMQPEDLRTMLTDLDRSTSVSVQSIHLNWRGEPLMNPRFNELLQVTADVMPQAKLQWHTNGTMLTDKRIREILAVKFPHKIFVSLDGGNRFSHDLNRGEGNFEKALLGLERLLDQAQERPDLTIGVYQIDLGEPLEEYDPRFLKLLQRVGHYEKVKPLLPGGAEQAIADVDDLQSQGTLDKMLSEEVLPYLPVPQLPCFWAGHVFCVAPTGDVSICVISHGASGVVGNLLHDGVDRVLAGALAFRCRLADHGRSAISHCATCRKPAGRIFPQHLKPARVAA